MLRRLFSKRSPVDLKLVNAFSKKESDYQGGFKKVDAEADVNFETYWEKSEAPPVKDTVMLNRYENMPSKAMDPKKYVQEHEIRTRIMKVLSHFECVNLRTFEFGSKFSECEIDSLEQIAILTSIEEEFHTVFEDNVFESFGTMDSVVLYLKTDDCF